MKRFAPSLLAPCLIAVGITACGTCGGEEEAAPTVPESAGQGVTFNSATDAITEGSAEAAPERPLIVHEEPPTAADFAIDAVTGDWSTFRGAANRSGLREVRGIAEPHIAWSVQVGIQGYTNHPIVTEEAIYVASQGDRHQREDERDGVYAIDPGTGAILWRYATNQDANGLTLDGDTLIVGTDGRQLIGVDRNTGEALWTVDQDCQIYHAPATRDGQAILIRNAEVGTASIDIASGAVEGAMDCRRSERGAVSVDDERIYRGGIRELVAYDELGEAWRDDVVALETRARGRWMPPLLTENMLIDTVHGWPFEAGSDRLTLRPAAVARWQDNGQVAWVIDINDAAHANTEPASRDSAFLRSMPWVSGGRLYWTPTNAGTLVSYDVVTGERIGSIDFPDCRNRAFGSIVGTPNMGYYARHDGVLYGFSTEPLAIRWTLGLGLHGAAGSSRQSHVPVSGGCSAQPKNGEAMFSTPSIASDGTLYVGSGDGWLYAIVDQSW